MPESTIRPKIQDILETVSGIVVHGRRRYSRSPGKFLEMLRADGVVSAWTVHRKSVVSKRETIPNMTRAHTFEIMGFHDFVDEGEDFTADDFQALLDTVFDAFKNEKDLGGTCLKLDPFDVIDIDEQPLVKDGDTIYHVAECRLVCYERVSYSL